MTMQIPYIEHYRFGKIVIDRQTFSKDVIIFPNRVFSPWWRQKGHVLHIEDLAEVFEAAPKTLIVGQGAYGRMAIPAETRQAIEAAGIELVAVSTKEACQTYNSLREQGDTVAALHLTC